MNDLVTLTLLGVRVVLVHGGGPAINSMLKKLGIESKFVNGLRYTDAETMAVVQQVLAGQVNKDLVALLKGRGVGLCGMDGNTISCRRYTKEDLGFVGEITGISTTLINTCWTTSSSRWWPPWAWTRRTACSTMSTPTPPPRPSPWPGRRKAGLHDRHHRPAAG